MRRVIVIPTSKEVATLPELVDAPSPRPSRRPQAWGRWRFLISWLVAITLLGVAVPRVVDVSWHGVIPVLTSVHWPAFPALALLWFLGLVVHSFVLTAAAPRLTHRRALTLNMAGSAVANVVPLGGAAGIELNRRMMKAWGIEARAFTGYTFLTNLWDVGSKLLLPVLGVVVLARAGEAVTPQLRTVSLLASVAFVALALFVAVLLLSQRGTRLLGHAIEQTLRPGLRLIGRDRTLGICAALDDVRRQSADLVARGWLRMTAGMVGYVALQWLLLGFCLQLTGAGTTWPEVLAGFAVERLFTIIPITPGGVGVADLGLVGVLLTLGGDPAGVAAAAVLYRLFVFAVEIPVGSGVLGVWFLAQRRTRREAATARSHGPTRRIVHVTDVFLPRLGGIETHVDDLVRHQRATGLHADVLTPTDGTDADPVWVRRMPVAGARSAVTEYDAVHIHLSMWSPYGLAVARAATDAGIPILITVHSMWEGVGGLLRLFAVTSLRQRPVVWSAVSTAAARTFRRALGDLDVAVLPNAIDVAAWRPTPRAPGYQATVPADAAPDDNADDTPVTLVSVMRLVPRKRPLALVKMFAEVRRLVPEQDLKLVVVGDGPLRRRTERYVRRHGLCAHVRITGRVRRRDVLDELQAASIYIAPASRESFGIAALEARCAGLPVIAHRRSGVSEFVRDRIDGVLVANDSEMVVAVAELISNPALRDTIATHNARVPPRHDWNDILEQTEKLYQQAAAIAATPTTVAVPAHPPIAAGA